MSQITRRHFLCELIAGGASAFLLMSFGRNLSALELKDEKDFQLADGTVLIRNPAYSKKEAQSGIAILEIRNPNGEKTAWRLDEAASFAWDHIVSYEAYSKKQHITIHRLLDMAYQKYPDEPKDKLRKELMNFLNQAVRSGILLLPPVKATITERSG